MCLYITGGVSSARVGNTAAALRCSGEHCYVDKKVQFDLHESQPEDLCIFSLLRKFCISYFTKIYVS